MLGDISVADNIYIMCGTTDMRKSIVTAKYFSGFPDSLSPSIIVVVRYLDYFTTIMEDRLWQVLAKPVFPW